MAVTVPSATARVRVPAGGDTGAMSSEPALRMYTDLAPWWPLISPPDEYAEEAAEAARHLRAAAIPVREVLELGSGGGNNAVHLRAWFTMTLVDLNPAMLEVSEALNPGCEHVAGDMRTVRLGRTFDAVFVHDAVCYLLTEDDVLACLITAREHCRPGGIVVVVPDDTARDVGARHRPRRQRRPRRPRRPLPHVGLGSRSDRHLDR